MSSADGWLVEGESPKQAPGLCREKRRPKTGEGRAYTQNPTTAQARDRARASQLFRQGGRLRHSEGEPGHAETAKRGAVRPRAGAHTNGSQGAAALDRPRAEL